MDFVFLFTRSAGRISRQWFWLGMLTITAVTVVAFFSLVLFFLNGWFIDWPTPVNYATMFAMIFAWFYPLYMIIVKRLHDRDRPDHFAWLMLAPSLVNVVGSGVGLDAIIPRAADYLVQILVLAAFIWIVVELGFLRGTVGPNRYGPDPADSPQR